jgi:hypothetical protein
MFKNPKMLLMTLFTLVLTTTVAQTDQRFAANLSGVQEVPRRQYAGQRRLRDRVECRRNANHRQLHVFGFVERSKRRTHSR